MSNKKNRYIENEKKKNKQRQMVNNANKHINLGLIVYFLIFSYLIFCVLNFSFAKKTSYTIAEPGEIIESEVFNGFIIRDESIVSTNAIGQPNYFIPEGKKVKKGTLISFVERDENIISNIEENLQGTKEKQLSEIDLSNHHKLLQDKLKNYVLTKNSKSFEATYSTKKEIEKAISDLSNTILLEDNQILKKLLKASSVKEENIYFAPMSGVVSYQFDGFEDSTVENFNPIILDQTLLNKDEFAQANNTETPLFKIIDNYNWYLAAEINDICEKYLEGKTYATISIYYNNMTAQGRIYKIFHHDDKAYLILEFDRYLNEFINERFLDFKIVYSNIKGIKIPLTAITKKDFLKIPIDALLKSNQIYEVKKQIISDKFVGGESLERIYVNQYRVNDQYAYIPVSEELNIGDTIIYQIENGSNSEFTITESLPIEGVFVTNKGYAAFKFIEVLSYTKDYKIVKETTSFGVNAYDRIATDGSLLKENQIIH